MTLSRRNSGRRARAGVALITITAASAVGIATTPSRADAAITFKSSFTPGIGGLVGVAYDNAASQVFVYPDFSNAILRYTPAGVQVPPDPPMPGTQGDDFDLDFATRAMTVNGTAVPAGSLLYVNGDQGNRLSAVNKVSGAVIAAKVLAGGGTYVGASHHSVRNTMFAVDRSSDTVREVNPNTGVVVASWTAAPPGRPAFDVSNGDVEANGGNGHLYVVGSSQDFVREFTATGAFVADINVAPLGVSTMSGIAFDETTGDAYISTTNGDVFRLGGFPAGCGGKAGTIIGGTGNDTLTGTAGGDVIIGLAGNDTITAAQGNDQVCAGSGNDTVHGGIGNDGIRGGSGVDTVNGNDGADTMDGGTGTPDTCNGGPGTPDTAVNCELISGVP